MKKNKFYLVFYLVILVSNFIYGAIPASERVVLINFYKATGGDNWTDKSGWKTPPLHTDGFAKPGTEGAWYGIIVSADHVMGIYLESNNLSGSITVTIKNLSQLKYLSLYTNKLNGGIPKELGNLSNLSHLDLEDNQLTGIIPKELGNLSNLQVLWLSSNQITGSIPPEMGNLSNLKELYLHENQLTGSIPPEMGNLSNLQVLWLSSNQITGSIPPEMGHLSNLVDLYLYDNQLTGSIPLELGNLSNLQFLDLGWNALTGSIPPEMGHLSNLVDLYLYGNQLTGSIPLELGNLSKLQYLELRWNALTGSIPPVLGNLSNLKTLDLWNNQLSGSIPPELKNLSNLQYLDLSWNALTGSIPSELKNLSNLQYLYLEQNALTGSIPPVLGNLSNLKTFSLWNNQLSGSIPPELKSLSNLQNLDLEGNALTGSILPELGNLSNLQYLNLGENVLTGSIPKELKNLSKLKGLSVAKNLLTGSIPTEIGNLLKLEHLYLDNNKLSGDIPKTLIKLIKLKIPNVNIGHNCLYSNDAELKKWLNGIDPTWALNQTECTSPKISVSRTSLNFSYIIGSSNIPRETFTIYNSGGGDLNWSVSTKIENFTLNPTSGTNCDNVEVTINSAGLLPAKYEGVIYVTDPFASNSPVEVKINLWVKTNSESSPPFGDFSTPIDNSTVQNSVPVTGWALGGTGIENVKIYREEGSTLVFIGDAIFVEGARPDIEAAYPDYPMNYKAGWGYMMLTHFLPNGGNGTFKIHAVATDKEERTTTLGVKTITVDNTNAVKPFGAIDTPSQGGIASGNNFINWGWVLTPPPSRIPTDGSTIKVWLDGVNFGHPYYNEYRSDIAELFPGYANSNGAGGYYYFDTTRYLYGKHTISWTATDDTGNTDGIGSRYFTIQNTDATAGYISQNTAAIAAPLDIDLSAIPVDYSEPVKILSGFTESPDAPDAPEMYPNENGIIEIEIKELERIEIHVTQAREDAPMFHYTGYLVVNDQLRPLPIGSTLDSQRGIFYWQPGVGFYGDYELVFIKQNNTGRNAVRVKVRILPKYNL